MDDYLSKHAPSSFSFEKARFSEEVLIYLFQSNDGDLLLYEGSDLVAEFSNYCTLVC